MSFETISQDEIHRQEIKMGKYHHNDILLYENKYNSEIILSLAKCKKLTEQFFVHIKKDHPICFEFNIGSIGTLKIFINSYFE